MGSVIVLLVIIAFYEVYKRYLKPVMSRDTDHSALDKTLSKLSDKEYTVLHDSSKWYLIVSVYGIFVLNVMTYTGWITGNENSKQWTVTGKESLQFDNPLFENEKVIENIKKLLKERYVPMYSLVVFPDNTRLHVEAFDASVIQCRSLQNEIQRYSANAVMPSSQKNELVTLLKENQYEPEYKGN